MVTWFKSFSPTACFVFVGRSVPLANSGTLSGRKSSCFLMVLFSCACSAGPEEEEVDEENEGEKKQDEEGGFHLLSEAFISPDHCLKDYNKELGAHEQLPSVVPATCDPIVTFTFVKIFIAYSLFLRDKLRRWALV